MTEIARAGTATVWGLVAARARHHPERLALAEGDRRITYAGLMRLACRTAAGLAARGVVRGDRVAVLSENCADYTILQLACARIGAIAACLNWRLVAEELRYCIDLVDPALVVASARHADLARAAGRDPLPFAALDAAGESPDAAGPEDGFLIIYTSGTTGRPKAAVISHRAQIARMCALRMDMGLAAGDGYVAWAPMFHIGGTEHLFSTLMGGGPAVICDGFQPDAIIDALEAFPIGWLMTVPATTELLLARLEERRPAIRGVKAVGCMADMVPAAVIDAITRALDAPWLNSFGATETGMPPLSADLIRPGEMPRALAKQPNLLTDLRLVGPDGADVADGAVGEAWVRGPTLFSGYWNNDAANAKDFAGGWFHMGDLFRRTAAGYEFAGRSKYLIKSGGENIYPAEIERVILADSRVADAIVVRRADPRWGEVPVAVIARTDDSLDAAAVEAMCRAGLAGYKRPRDVVFVALGDLPRNVSGKILRESVEAMVALPPG